MTHPGVPRLVPVLALVATFVIAAPMAALGDAPDAPSEPPTPAQTPSPAPDAPVETATLDRYDLANGCWALRDVASGTYVARDGDGFAATAGDLDEAEPFHLEPTELGVYLFYAAQADFVMRQGDGVQAWAAPSPDAEWVAEDVSAGSYAFRALSDDAALSVGPDGGLEVGTDPSPASFAVEPVDGCADWPDPQINITGEHPTGDSELEEVRGYVDGHLHQMAFEFLGGEVHCGRPWHRYGVTFALVDCPDHEVGGPGGALEQALGGEGLHDTVGWPTFGYWPAPHSLTHEQTYYSWMERNWRGGLRLFTNLFVENGALCELYPLNRNSCDEMDSVRLQLADINALQDYIDAQSGGPGEGWFRIVTDPFEARRVMNEGRLAVVLGIETSLLFGCGLEHGQPTCTTDDIDAQLAEFHDAGVRQMELVNKFDSALSGVAGDSGSTGIVVNTGNFYETGRFWDMRTCDHDHGEHVHDKNQEHPPSTIAEQDALFGAIYDAYGPGAPTPVYPAAPHCNDLGLGDLGAYVLDRMIERGMIIDPDHMSVKGREQALARIETAGYEGVMSSHGWSDPYAYERILEMGGFIAARSGGNTASFVQDWRDLRGWSDPRYYFGLGYGADANGLGAQPAALQDHLDEPVTYPFTGFGGVTVDQQVSGERVYDVNVDGVAHYGVYPDWIEGLRLLAGDDIQTDLQRAPEAYLQMWERAIGVPGDSCRPDVPALTQVDLDAVAAGASWEEVLRALGQARVRQDHTLTYCTTDGLAVLSFDAAGSLHGIERRAGSAPALGADDVPSAAPAPPLEPDLPATGGGLVALASLLLGVVMISGGHPVTGRRRDGHP